MDNEALIIIDVQNDFCPGGALAISDGDEIIPIINKLVRSSPHVILTQDWHSENHTSFASSHQGLSPYDTITMEYGRQTLWPDHCIQGTTGADFHPELDIASAELVIRKGYHPTIDSYSAFFENDRKTPTGLGGYLRDRNLEKLTFCGLATDFCVAYSALDAIASGFQASVILEACRAIDLNGSLELMLNEMQKKGVELFMRG